MLVKTPQVAEKDMWHQFLLTSCVVILKSFAILAIQSARAFEKSLRGCGHAAGQKRCQKDGHFTGCFRSWSLQRSGLPTFSTPASFHLAK